MGARCALAVAIVCLLAGRSFAEPLVYEPFNYTAGQDLLGQMHSSGRPWRRAAPAATPPTDIDVAAGNLTPPAALGPPSGNSASISGNGNLSGAATRLGLGTGVTSGTVYYSFVMRATALTGSNQTIGGFFAALNNTGDADTTTTPTVGMARVQARIDPADPARFNLGVFNNRTAVAGDPSWSGALAVNQDLFVVASYTIDAAGTDTSRMWINPGNL